MNIKNEILIHLLNAVPDKLGKVESTFHAPDAEFVVIFMNTPWNYSVQINIAKILSIFVRNGMFEPVCVDNAYGYIDTAALREFPEDFPLKVIEDTADRLLRRFKIGAAEYCSCLNPDKPFTLCGIEDEDLHEQAVRLWRSRDGQWTYIESDDTWSSPVVDAFNELEKKRAGAMYRNLRQKMRRHGVRGANIAAVVCCGRLPQLLSSELKQAGVSYALIRPAKPGPGDHETYLKKIQGVPTLLESIISRLPEKQSWPGPGETWKDYRRKDMARLKTEVIGMENVVSDLKQVVTSRPFRALSLEQKRILLNDPNELFVRYSIQKRCLPDKILNKLYTPEQRRYRGMEEILSDPRLVEIIKYEPEIDDLLQRLPDTDLAGFLHSRRVVPEVRQALKKRILETRVRGVEVEKAVHEIVESESDFPLVPETPDSTDDVRKRIASLDAGLRDRFAQLSVFPEQSCIPVSVVKSYYRGLADLDEVGVMQVIKSLEREQLVVIRRQRVSISPVVHRCLNALAPPSADLHDQLVKVYQKQRIKNEGWHFCPNDGYCFQHLPAHMLKAHRIGELLNLLTDLYWIRKKLDAAGFQSLMRDYADVLSVAPTAPIDDGWRSDLKDLKDALRLAATVLNDSPDQLASQLIGRLAHHPSPRIRSILEKAAQEDKGVKLMPLMATLGRAGEYFIGSLKGHAQEVNSIKITPDGRYVFSASCDATIKQWDIESGAIIRTFRAHRSAVNDLLITPDGSRLISASGENNPESENTIRIWDLSNGKCLHQKEHKASAVRALTITPEGKRILYGCGNHNPYADAHATLQVWDLQKRDALQWELADRHGPISTVAISGDGIWAASGEASICLPDPQDPGYKNGFKDLGLLDKRFQKLPAGGIKNRAADNTLKLWDLDSGRLVRTIRRHGATVTDVAFSPDNRRIISCSLDKTIRVFDLASGKELKILIGHEGGVQCLAVLPDGKHVISAAKDQSLIIWDISEETLQSPGCGVPLVRLNREVRDVTDLAISPDGGLLVTAHNTGEILMWRMDAILASADRTAIHMHDDLRHNSVVSEILVSADGAQTITSACDGEIKIWSTNDGAHIHSIAAKPTSYSPVFILPGGTFLARNIDIEGGQLDRAGVPMAASHNGDYLLYGNRTLTLFDLKRLKPVRELAGHTQPVLAVAATGDPGLWISSGMDQTVIAWDAQKGQAKCTLQGHKNLVKALAVSGDGKMIASGDGDGMILLWDVALCACIARFQGHKNIILSLAFSQDGQQLISVSGDCEMRGWDLNALSPSPLFIVDLGETMPRRAAKPSTLRNWIGSRLQSRLKQRADGDICNILSAAVIVPQANLAVAATRTLGAKSKSRVCVWHTQSGEKIRGIHQSLEPVADVFVTQDAKHLAIGHEKKVSIWNLESLDKLTEFTCDSSVTRIAADPGTEYFMVGEASGRVHFLRLHCPIS